MNNYYTLKYQLYLLFLFDNLYLIFKMIQILRIINKI